MHTNIKNVRVEQKGDHQPLLRAVLKLVKFLHCDKTKCNCS